MQSILDVIFENFLIIVVVLISVTFIFGMTVVKMFMDRIETRVLYLRKNDAIWYRAQINKGGNITFKIRKEKYTVVKNSDPYILKMGRTFVTLYLVKEGEKVTMDVRADRSKKYKNVKELEIALNELVEAEITRQAVKGLTEGLDIPIMYQIGLISIGMAILYFIQLIVERIR